MNKLSGNIKNIETSDNISLIDIEVHDSIFCSIVINTDGTDDYLKVGNNINLLFKETEVDILPYRNKKLEKKNKLVTKIDSFKLGKILTELNMNYYGNKLTALILSRHMKKYNFQIGDKIILLIRTQEILLMP